MPPEGARRSSRIPREIAILLVGSDMEGKMFSEQTKTVVLSCHGAGIVSQYALSAEQELILRRLDTDKEAEVRVVGQLGAHDKTYTYGVAFLNPDLDLWGIKFPRMTDSEKEASRVLLQCSSCKAREMVQHSDLESDVYLVNEGIVRSCKSCGSSTFWKRATDDTGDEPVPRESVPPEAEEVGEPVETSPAASLDSARAPAPAARPENKRKHVRTTVNFKAFVRSQACDMRGHFARRAPLQEPEGIRCENRDRSGCSLLTWRTRHFCPWANCLRRGIETGKTIPLRGLLRRVLRARTSLFPKFISFRLTSGKLRSCS